MPISSGRKVEPAKVGCPARKNKSFVKKGTPPSVSSFCAHAFSNRWVKLLVSGKPVKAKRCSWALSEPSLSKKASADIRGPRVRKWSRQSETVSRLVLTDQSLRQAPDRGSVCRVIILSESLSSKRGRVDRRA